MEQSIMKHYDGFMQALRYCEHPLVAYYSDEKPEPCCGPKGGFSVEINSPVDALAMVGRLGTIQKEKKEKYRCMFLFLNQTRKTGIPSVFDHENYGCPGCRFYLGFIPKLPRFNHFFTTTGLPLVHKGERLGCSPQSSEKLAALLEGLKPKGKYLIFRHFHTAIPTLNSEPEIVLFFSNPEIIAGLVGLVRFVSDEADTVVSPYASGCASIFSWPVKYRQDGVEKAVLGIFDTAARPYLRLGEMALSIQFPLFVKMLESYKKSFINIDKIKDRLIKEAIPGWPEVRERAKKIQKRLNDDDDRFHHIE